MKLMDRRVELYWSFSRHRNELLVTAPSRRPFRPTLETILKLLCLSDYKGAGQWLPLVPQMVRVEDPDLIFYCGGSMRGDERILEYETARKFHSKPDLESPKILEEIQRDTEFLQQFILALADTQKTVYAIPGNTDAPEPTYFKTIYNYAHIYPNLKPAHELMFREDQFMVAGFGGDITYNDDNRELVLQYSKTWVEFALRRLEFFPGEKVLMFHTPPVCRLDLMNGDHCGVLLINELIERISPKLVLCGKARSGQGVVRMGPAHVVNPGNLADGHYAVIDYPSFEVSFKNLSAL